MADEKPKSIGDKVIDIIHSIYHSSDKTGGESSGDPVANKVIDDLSKKSIVGGQNRKKKMDDAITEAGG